MEESRKIKNLKITFASGRVIEIESVKMSWAEDTLGIDKPDGSIINISYYTVETIEVSDIE